MLPSSGMGSIWSLDGGDPLSWGIQEKWAWHVVPGGSWP